MRYNNPNPLVTKYNNGGDQSSPTNDHNENALVLNNYNNSQMNRQKTEVLNVEPYSASNANQSSYRN